MFVRESKVCANTYLSQDTKKVWGRAGREAQILCTIKITSLVSTSILHALFSDAIYDMRVIYVIKMDLNPQFALFEEEKRHFAWQSVIHI